MVMTARALDAPRPLPSAAGGLLRVADGVTFIEDDDGSGAVFLWGTAAWCWAAGDRVARRLAAVQLVETKAARQRHVAAAFGVNEDSLILWRGEYCGERGDGAGRPAPGPEGTLEADRGEAGRDRRVAGGGVDVDRRGRTSRGLDRHRAPGAGSGAGAGSGGAPCGRSGRAAGGADRADRWSHR